MSFGSNGVKKVPHYHMPEVAEAVKKVLEGRQYVVILVDLEDQTQIDMISSFEQPSTKILLSHILSVIKEKAHSEVENG